MKYRIKKYSAYEFERQIQSYKQGYKKKYGRSLPSNTILVRAIELEQFLPESKVEEYIRIHEKHIGGKCLRKISMEEKFILIWFWADENTYQTCKLKKGEIHALRMEVEESLGENWKESLNSKGDDDMSQRNGLKV